MKTLIEPKKQIERGSPVNNGNQKLTRFRQLKNIASKRRQLRRGLPAAANGASSGINYVPLTVPGPDPSNQEAVKYYVFNQTGNIMMSSTDLTSASITQPVRDVFNEVSVFFAAMTKAISTTINPVTKSPFSIYDYNALMGIISGSGLFVHVTEEDIKYHTSSFGTQFSTELIEGLLGLATGSGELAFADAMIASMGSAAVDISSQSSSSDSKVANIVFICEYLLGMPIVSAMVVYCDASEVFQVVVGPCFSETTVTTDWTMHKDTYMFVTPKFIEQYAGDLLAIESDAVYSEFIAYLSNLITSKPNITAVNISGTNTPAPLKLTEGTAYQIIGENFGTKPGKLSLGATSPAVGQWNSNTIVFTPSTAIATGATVDLFMPGNTTTTPDASSISAYTVGT